MSVSAETPDAESVMLGKFRELNICAQLLVFLVTHFSSVKVLDIGERAQKKRERKSVVQSVSSSW